MPPTCSDVTAPGQRRHFTRDPRGGTDGVYATLCGRTIEAREEVVFGGPKTASIIRANRGGWNICSRCLVEAR